MLLTGMHEIEDRFLDKIFNLATRNRQVKIDDPRRLEKVTNPLILNNYSTLHLFFFFLKPCVLL